MGHTTCAASWEREKGLQLRASGQFTPRGAPEGPRCFCLDNRRGWMKQAGAAMVQLTVQVSSDFGLCPSSQTLSEGPPVW